MGRKVISMSYSSAILKPLPQMTLNGFFPNMISLEVKGKVYHCLTNFTWLVKMKGINQIIKKEFKICQYLKYL